jgi:general secretion pathway protein G
VYQDFSKVKMFKNYKSGFTLLELLVVISIIGILLAIGTVAYSSAQKKGRDARRKSDVKAMQKAMEQYYAENTGYGSDTSCQTQLGAHMDHVPTDPKAGNYSFDCAADGSGYTICGDLEKIDADGNGDFFEDGAEEDFCVSNLQ